MNVIVNEHKCFNLWKQDLSMADYREVHHQFYFCEFPKMFKINLTSKSNEPNS